MKGWIIMLLGAVLASSGKAQIFTPESFGGAALGGIAGAIIGNQVDGQSGEGAAIGAGIGYLLGEVAHANRQRREAEAAAYDYPNPDSPYGYQTAHQPSYRGNFLYAPYRYYRPNYALSGAALGGVSGAIIGNQVDGQAGEGAAIGAAAGLVLGGLAESHARAREAQAAYPPPTAPQVEPARPAPAASPERPLAGLSVSAQAVASNTSMQQANRLFGR